MEHLQQETKASHISVDELKMEYTITWFPLSKEHEYCCSTVHSRSGKTLEIRVVDDVPGKRSRAQQRVKRGHIQWTPKHA